MHQQAYSTHGKSRQISPVSSSGKICDLLSGHTLRNKRWYGMAYEHICLRDFRPQMVPDILLRRPGRVAKVAADLDVTSVEYWPVGRDKLDEGN